MVRRAPRPLPVAVLLVLALGLAACGGTSSGAEVGVGEPAPGAEVAAEVAAEVVSEVPAEVAGAPTTVPAGTPVTSPPITVPARVVHQQAWIPFARVDQVVLHHPSARVERVGFHESNVDGARQLDPLPTAAPWVTLEGRGRDTGSRTAADIVVDPEAEIRAPVTGRVLWAGTYVLYCDYRDDYAVIEPDARPGWQVKILHIDGVTVGPGDRVEAGQTVIAPRPTRLPFESQVDETTASPAWPHVHVEVIDPSIPDRPSGRAC